MISSPQSVAAKRSLKSASTTMINESPSRAGWRLVLENPKLFLIELTWRWGFGTVALLLAVQASAVVMRHVTVSDAHWAALHSQDLVQAANALVDLILVFWRVIGLALAGVLPAMALAWIIFATWGRAATLTILQQTSGFWAVAASNLLRVFLVVLTGIATVLVIAGAAQFSTRFSANPNEPNLALYLLIVLVALPVIVVLWAGLNWVLSLVPLFCIRERKGVFASIAAALSSLRASRSAYWSVTGVYGSLRAIGLLVVMVLAVLLGALGQNWIVLSLLVALVLLYFAFADLLYIARMAAYLQIIEQSSPARIKTSPAADATAK